MQDDLNGFNIVLVNVFCDSLCGLRNYPVGDHFGPRAPALVHAFIDIAMITGQVTTAVDLYVTKLTERERAYYARRPGSDTGTQSRDRDRRVRRSSRIRAIPCSEKICRCNFCERHTTKVGHRRSHFHRSFNGRKHDSPISEGMSRPIGCGEPSAPAGRDPQLVHRRVSSPVQAPGWACSAASQDPYAPRSLTGIEVALRTRRQRIAPALVTKRLQMNNSPDRDVGLAGLGTLATTSNLNLVGTD